MAHVPTLDSVIEAVASLLAKHYVFPAIGVRAAASLTATFSKRGLDEPPSPDWLADAVTAHLQAVTGDKHLRLLYHEEELADFSDPGAELAYYAALADKEMRGIRRVERLAHNVAVLSLGPVLYPPVIAGDHIHAAMSLVATADALIIDVRGLRGGDPDSVALLCSHLFEKRTHLNSMVDRDGGREESWSSPSVPGARFGEEKPVWVVTDEATFSGGEELAYDLQQLNRAVVVGAPTGGGAHARIGFVVTPHLEVTIPVVRPENPRSGTNWEGVGVVPDEIVDPAIALDHAYTLARSRLGLP